MSSGESLINAGISSAGVTEKSENEREPEPPKDLLPSKANYLKHVRFNPYKSTRPDLLANIQRVVEDGLRELRSNYGDDIERQNLVQLYSSAFQVYVEQSTIYQPFLRTVKEQYDEALKEMKSKIHSYSDFEKQLEEKDKFLSNQLEENAKQSKLKLSECQEKISSLESSLAKANASIKALEESNRMLKATNSQLKEQYNQTKNTCAMLSSSLARLEEDRWRYESMENARVLEITNLKHVEIAQNNELERLQQLVAQKEMIQETLVGPEVLAAKEDEIASMKKENERINATHRHLLIRYTAIKLTIDSSLKHVDDLMHQSERQAHHSAAESKVIEIMRDYEIVLDAARKREEIKAMNPRDKIIQLVETSKYPQIIFESLLDHIERLQSERLRAVLASNEKADALMHIAQTAGGEDEEEDFMGDGANAAGEYIIGLGTSDNVPCYLRYSGNIRRMPISRSKLVELIHEVWTAKAQHDGGGLSNFPRDVNSSQQEAVGAVLEDGGQPNVAIIGQASVEGVDEAVAITAAAASSDNESPSEDYVPLLPKLSPTASMAEFFECFLKDKVKDHRLAIELAYNIIESLRTHSSENSDFRLFAAVLEGQLPSAIWFDQLNMLSKLRAVMDKENTLTPEKFMRLLKKVCNTKNDEYMESLSKALLSEQREGRYVNPAILLYEDTKKGTRTAFYDLLTTQHMNECIEMERVVMTCIDQLARTEQDATEIVVSKLREALALADANKTRLELNQLLARGANCSIEDILIREAKRIPLSVEDFKRNLKTGLLKKSPQPPPRKPKK